MNYILIFGVVVAAFVLVFGAANILSASNKGAEIFKQVSDETDYRCDLCLSQFYSEVRCAHGSDTKVCIALKNYYCAMNCSVTVDLK